MIGNCQGNEKSNGIKSNSAVRKGRLDLTENLISDLAELLEKIFPECKRRIENIEEKMVGIKDREQ